MIMITKTPCNNVNQYYKHNGEQKNPDTKDYIPYGFIYIKEQKQVNRNTL